MRNLTLRRRSAWGVALSASAWCLAVSLVMPIAERCDRASAPQTPSKLPAIRPNPEPSLSLNRPQSPPHPSTQPLPKQDAPRGEAAREALSYPATQHRFAAGTYLSCYEGYHPEGSPVQALTRLAYLCGPYHGMQPAHATVSGVLPPDASDIVHAIALQKNDCARVFAVAEPSVKRIAVRMRTTSGLTIAEATGADRWLVVASDRLLCVPDAGTYEVAIRAIDGLGAYALQVWILR